jgi:hypothetical protein
MAASGRAGEAQWNLASIHSESVFTLLPTCIICRTVPPSSIGPWDSATDNTVVA